MLADAIEGNPRAQVMRPRQGDYAGDIASIMAGIWKAKPRCAIHSTGYVAHSLEAALWAVSQTEDFGSAILLAANLGGDADTTAAITGQLAGALYGLSGIPMEWMATLAWADEIIAVAERLVALSNTIYPEETAPD